jgi:autotransporter-associated beta strand protein
MFGTSEGRRNSLRLPRASHWATPVIGAIAVVVSTFSGNVARAQDAMWRANPGTNDFDTATNWNPAQIPGGTASFGMSATTSLSFSTNTTVGGFTFNTGASDFTFSIDHTLTFNGAGIVINGGSATINNNFPNGGLTFDNSSTAGSATINNNSNLTFENHSTAGSANIDNPGGHSVLGFTDFSAADHATITNGGTLFFTNNSTADHANITNNTTLDFFVSSTAGSATITNNAGADIHFNNSSKAGSAQITNNNNLEFDESSTAENATITTTNTGTTFINDSASGGAARFILKGGALDISGVTSGSTLAGSIEGDGKVFLGANNLAVGGNNLSTTFSGVIQDLGKKGGTGGSLSKEGAGTLILTGINTYAGTTTVDAGVLEVDGSIATSGSAAVNSGGTLRGIGTVTGTTVNGGGTLAPGNAANPLGTLTITGNLAFQSGALYMIGINSSSASQASVFGTATLNSGASVKIASGSTPQIGVTYTILTSTTVVLGTFNPTVQFGDLTGTLIYDDPMHVFLTFKISSLKALLPPNAPLNAVNVANAIDNFIHSGGTLPAGFQNVFNFSPAQLVNALLQIDGEVGTGAEKAAFRLLDQFLELMLDPFVYGRSGGAGAGATGFAPEQHASFPPDIALAYGAALKAPPKSSFDQRWTVWGASFGASATAKGNAAVIGSSNITASDYGFAVGADYHYSPDTVLGFALAGAGTNWGLASNFGTGRSDAFMAGGYGISHFGPAYLAADVAFANHWFTTNRTALSDQLTARFNGQSYGARIETGYRHAVPVSGAVIGVTPYAALQTQWFHTPSYSETDLTGGGFALSYNAMNGNDTRAEIGARFDSFTTVGGMPVQLRARAAWAHDWVSNPALNTAFQALPGAAFTVNGAPVPNNSALTSAGAQFYITPRLSLLAKFDGEFASSAQTYAGSGTLRYIW